MSSSRFTLGFLLMSMSVASLAKAQSGDNSASAIVREMSLARQNPALYASFIEEHRTYYQGNLIVRPGRVAFRTKEGTRAVDEAIRYLQKATPRAPLEFSMGMSRAAAEHCAEQAGGGMSHKGRNGSNTAERISRYGTWGGSWGENLACGRSGAREIVMALIIDDGVRGRKHRDNIFNPQFNYAGAAVGTHAAYRTICSIEFAGAFVEHDAAAAGTLVARN
jgi:uncharacterized protein YkwD